MQRERMFQDCYDEQKLLLFHTNEENKACDCWDDTSDEAEKCALWFHMTLDPCNSIVQHRPLCQRGADQWRWRGGEGSQGCRSQLGDERERLNTIENPSGARAQFGRRIHYRVVAISC